MRTLEEFESFMDSTPEIFEALQKIDTKRKSNVKLFLVMFSMGILFVAVMFYFSLNNTYSATEGQNMSYIIFGVFILLSSGYTIYMHLTSKAGRQSKIGYNNFTQELKDKVIRRIIGFWDPTYRYDTNSYVPLWKIKESSMFVDKEFEISGSDLVRGKYHDVPFMFSDVQLKESKLIITKYDNPEETIFHGSFFIADFNKSFTNPVYIYPKTNSGQYLQYYGEEVKLESPEFSKLFTVYSTDQIEARYILTTSMMERIMKLTYTMGKAIHIVFANNFIHIANNNSSDRFEAIWYQSVNRKEKLIEYFEELKEQLAIINDLKLNVDIWK